MLYGTEELAVLKVPQGGLAIVSQMGCLGHDLILGKTAIIVRVSFIRGFNPNYLALLFCCHCILNHFSGP